MTDLTDFGVDIEEPAEEAAPAPEPTPKRQYRHGRCPAIAKGSRRCQNPTSRMLDNRPFCGTHANQRDPWTIHDDPETLITVLGRKSARCRAIQRNGERCENACYPTDYLCGIHEDAAAPDLIDRDDLNRREVDAALIQQALAHLEDEDDTDTDSDTDTDT